MKRSLLAAAALMLMAITAQAASTTLFFSSYWRATYVSRNSDGLPMCLMHSKWRWAHGVTGSITMKWTAKDGLFMHVAKSNWSLPVDAEMPLSITLDGGVLDVIGSALQAKGGDVIHFTVPTDAAIDFLEDIGAANTLIVSFKQGDERPWIGQMIGSRKATTWFAACMLKIADAAKGATSPIGPKPPSPAKPTQPFGKPPASSSLRRDDGSI